MNKGLHYLFTNTQPDLTTLTSIIKDSNHDLLAITDDGNNAILLYCSNPQVNHLDSDILDYLYSLQVDFNLKNNLGLDIITTYIQKSPNIDPKIIQLLVKYRVNVYDHPIYTGSKNKYRVNVNGHPIYSQNIPHTSVIEAIKRNASLEIISTLIELGADLNYINSDTKGNILFEYFSSCSHITSNDTIPIQPDVLEYLMSNNRLDINHLDSKRNNLLMCYLKHQKSINPNFISQLLQLGINPGNTNNMEENAMSIYIIYHATNKTTTTGAGNIQYEVVEALVKGGVDINHICRRYHMFTPILYAAERSCPFQVYEILISLGADIKADNLLKQNILMVYLLNHAEIYDPTTNTNTNTNLELNDSNDGTMIDFNTLVETVHYLLSKVSIASRDNKSNNALYNYSCLYKKKVDYRVVKLLIDAGADVINSSCVSHTITYGYIVSNHHKHIDPLVIQAFIDAGVNVDVGANTMYSPITSVLRYRAPLDVIKLLFNINEISKKNHFSYSYVNPTSKMNFLTTYLQAQNTNPEDINTVKYIISCMEGDINEFRYQGKNVLMLYLLRPEDINPATIAQLFEAGIDPRYMYTVQGIDLPNSHENSIDGANAIGVYLSRPNKPVDAEVIKALVAGGVDINQTSDVGISSLLYAAKYSHSVDTYQTLINYGADVDVRDEKGRNVLMVYLNNLPYHEAFADLPSLRYLISLVDINAKDNNGLNALYQYCINSKLKTVDYERVKCLIEAGIDVINAHPTPHLLLLAYLYRNKDNFLNPNIISLLAEQGVDPNLSFSISIIMAPFLSSTPPPSTFINFNTNSNTVTYNPLMYAMRYGLSLTVIQTLIASGADVGYIDPISHDNILTVYITYLRRDNEVENILKYLLSFDNVNINYIKPDDEENNLLMIYFNRAMKITTEMIDIFINLGLNINHINKKGHNILTHYIANRSVIDPNVLDTLINARVDVNNTSPINNMSPIMYVANQSLTFNTFNTLIKHGANVTQLTADNRNILMIYLTASASASSSSPLMNLRNTSKYDHSVFELLIANIFNQITR